MMRHTHLFALFAVTLLLGACGEDTQDNAGDPAPAMDAGTEHDMGSGPDAGDDPDHGGGDTGDLPGALAPDGDEDNDGLTNAEEVQGYDILIDFSGFGLGFGEFLERRTVTSDPLVADTDGDGLTDAQELRTGSDPRSPDTDADSLTDAEEVNRWLTSPVSVDTDGDSRGSDPSSSLPPFQALFDAAELRLRPDPRDPDGPMVPGLGATSPISTDTDGDGVGDFDEIRNPRRRAHIAELPSVEIEIVDGVDIRLQVSFTDNEEITETFGASTERVREFGVSSTRSTSGTWSVSGSAQVTAGAKAGTKALALQGGIGGSVTGGLSETRSYSFSASSTESLTQEFRASRAASTGRTVSTEGGSMSVGLRVYNPGQIAYQISDFGVVVRQYVASEGRFRALTVLQPPAGFDSFVLAPGASTPVLAFSASDLDANLTRELLANPSSLSLEPAGYELSDRDGENFIFVTEATFSSTAMLLVDTGQDEPRIHRVATNVNRDAQGELAGIHLSDVLDDLGYRWRAEDGDLGYEALVEIDGVALEFYEGDPEPLGDPAYPEGVDPGPRRVAGIWAALGTSTFGELVLAQDFDKVILRNRDELRLVYLRDRDRDGLFDHEEAAYGSSDTSTHSDADSSYPQGDGLSDFFEAYVGWTVDTGQEGAEPYTVRSNPRLRDADNDLLDDRGEYEARSDPSIPDTDGDGIIDGLDPEPGRFTALAPEIVFGYASGGTGTTTAPLVNLLDANGDMVRLSIDWGGGGELYEVELTPEQGGEYDGVFSSSLHPGGESTEVVVRVEDATGLVTEDRSTWVRIQP